MNVLDPTRRFFVADLNVRGELRASAAYHYEQLEQIPGAADLITTLATELYRSPNEFEIDLPGSHSLRFRWRSSASSAGIATLRADGELASLALLASGIDADADRITLAAFQTHLLRELRDTPFEPAFALMDITERPLVAVVPFAAPSDQVDQLRAALADRCFAAAYFRYLHLA